MNINEDHTEPFPWAAMMAAGFGILRLSSAEFWAMTPRELNAAFHRPAVRVVPTRTALEQLMQAFPDEQ
ncbi:rcc01693 family protein [Phyllobacterium chamaecytisi]|uniref:rcc01693 family protein n=1 Tax=Phyllobacterium chamaecytisi TaxID=2876082 RepID=UPI001CD02046|nr:rcc01693 family protein [Phyllobacterium sp. KW56]MBZ9600418.1 phage tail assembly chaperone [Phyllobacterium sp. KW56]